MTSSRVWLITGASSGFGRAIADTALERGDRVVATARRVEALADLAGHERVHVAVLHVTDAGACEAAVAEAHERFGRIDVLVNNAGRTQVGAVEETTEDELRALFDLHFFGPAALTRLVLPGMRERGSGAIVQMSSVGGQVTAPGFGAYCATKFALEGLTETLQDEVQGFGIRTLIVEPGAFSHRPVPAERRLRVGGDPRVRGHRRPDPRLRPWQRRRPARRSGEGGRRDRGRARHRRASVAARARRRRGRQRPRRA